MPIKPENRHLYPPRKEWLAIRAEVLERDGNVCARCKVPNYAIGCWNEDGTFCDMTTLIRPDPGEKLSTAAAMRGLTYIVLTISHEDHDPQNNGTPGNRPNLKALCQRDHLAHDLAEHLANGRKTRDARKGQESLL